MILEHYYLPYIPDTLSTPGMFVTVKVGYLKDHVWYEPTGVA